HQEAAAARTNQFSADCSVCTSKLIVLIDLGIGHSLTALLFMFPVGMHNLGKFSKISGLKSLTALISHLFHKVQIVDHALILRLAALVLIRKNRRSASGHPSKEQQEIIFQIKQSFLGQLQWFS